MLCGLMALGALARTGDIVDDGADTSAQQPDTVSAATGSDDSSSTYDVGGLAPEANSSNFSSLISGSSPVVVDFHATWCKPCLRMDPVITALASSYPNQVFQLDIDKSEDIANQYNVHAVPSLIVFQNGREILRHEGIHSSDEISGWLASGSGSSSASPQVVQNQTVSAPAGQWGSPPDNSGGWAQVILNGSPAWNKGGASGQFVPVGQSAPAAAPAVSTPAGDPFAALFAPAAPVTSNANVVAQQTAPVAAVVNVSASPTDWSYVAAHGNRNWQAVYLDGNQSFRNKRTGKFVSSIVGMSGLGLAGVSGLLGTATVKVPSYTTEGGGGGSSLSVGTAGLILGGVAGTAILGYLAYRLLK